MSTTNIMIVGVGGQGTLLASRILGSAMLSAGYDVKLSEVHGMSQRGGSVVTYVRDGNRIDSPVICRGEAELLLAFEELEAARWLPYLKKGGTVITSTQRINPMPVTAGEAAYPEGLIEKMRALGVRVIALDALKAAREAGSEKAVNVVLIGVAAVRLGLDCSLLEQTIRETVPQKLLDINLRAFALGRELASHG